MKTDGHLGTVVLFSSVDIKILCILSLYNVTCPTTAPDKFQSNSSSFFSLFYEDGYHTAKTYLFFIPFFCGFRHVPFTQRLSAQFTHPYFITSLWIFLYRFLGLIRKLLCHFFGNFLWLIFPPFHFLLIRWFSGLTL